MIYQVWQSGDNRSLRGQGAHGAASWGTSGKARQDLGLVSGTLKGAESDKRKSKCLTHACGGSEEAKCWSRGIKLGVEERHAPAHWGLGLES